MTATPANLKHVRPPSGLSGWAAAYVLLDKIQDDTQRGLLVDIVRGLGVQGAPALEAAAGLAMWLTGNGQYRPPRKALKVADWQYVERRVRQELAKCDRGTFPRMRKDANAARRKEASNG
jgi:hypothetical protein